MKMNGRFWFGILAAAALSGGCALNPLYRVPPGATPDEVRGAMGEPWASTRQADGGTRWVYPTGPLGRHTYVAEFGADGRLRTFEDVLTDRGFARLRVGKTTEQELEQLFGPPYRVTRFDRLRQTAWDYLFTDNWNYPAVFSAMFDDQGVLVSTLQQREFYGGERMR